MGYTTRIAGVIVIAVLALLLAAAASTMRGHAQNHAPDDASIVGGSEVTPGAIPWQVWYEFTVQGESYSCGGSLIHPEWVLTAAHCLQGATVRDVWLGAHDIDAAQEEGRQVVAVARTVVHPAYDDTTLDNDIALLKLNTPATLTTRVQVIALARSPEDDAWTGAGTLAIVSGWGILGPNQDAPARLQSVDVPLVAADVCQDAYPGEITGNMLCAGYPEGGKDACEGDSGGPLTVPDGVGRRQVGIVSWGDECGLAGAYGVYAKVANYIGWINAETDDALTEPTPTATPSPRPTATPEATPVTPENVLRNGDFDLGPNGDWVEESRLGDGPGVLILAAAEIDVGVPATGYAAWLGGVDDEVSRVAQVVAVPATAQLRFDYQIVSEDECGFDVAEIVFAGAILQTYALCAQNATGGWSVATLDLADFDGQAGALEFLVETDELAPSSLLLDNIVLRRHASGGDPDGPGRSYLPLIAVP